MVPRPAESELTAMKEAKQLSALPTLADLEREVVAEYRDLGRQTLEQRLQQLADQTGESPPLRQRKRRPLTLRTELGEVRLTVDYGQQPATGKWHSPQQQVWGLTPHQKLTPGLAEKLSFTALATTSYEQAAAVAGRWGGWGRSLSWPMAACGFGTSWPTGLLKPPACWISIMPASISGRWRTRCTRKTQRRRGRGWNRCGTSCGTAAKPGCCRRCKTCRPGVRGGHKRCHRRCRRKSCILKNTGSIRITPRRPPKAVRWAAARWSPSAPNGKRCGQFWSEPGRRLMALEIARRNHDCSQVCHQN